MFLTKITFSFFSFADTSYFFNFAEISIMAAYCVHLLMPISWQPTSYSVSNYFSRSILVDVDLLISNSLKLAKISLSKLLKIKSK